MSKLRKRLAMWFLNKAKKLDEDTVYENTFVSPAPCLIPSSQPIIMYNEHKVNKIHAQHMLSRDTLMFSKNYDMDEYVRQSIVRGISEEMMKLYGDKIEQVEEPDGRIYSLDIYVCKPTKKETV